MKSLKLALLSVIGTGVATSQTAALADEGYFPEQGPSKNENVQAIDENLAFDQGAGYTGKRQTLPARNEAVVPEWFAPLGVTAASEETAPANEVAISSFGYGLSLPKEGDGTKVPEGKVHDVQPGPISRRSGGEIFNVDFVDGKYKKKSPIKISAIRLVGYSKKGGKVLVGGGSIVSAKGKATKIEALSKFASLPEGAQAENHKDKIMLRDGDAVTVKFETPLEAASLRLALEAYAENDASVVVVLQYVPVEGKKLFGVFTRRLVNPPEQRVGSSSPNVPSTGSGRGSSRPSEPSYSGAHDNEGGHTYGNTRFYSRGGSSHTYGNTSFYSRGGSSHSYGNTTFFSNGGSAHSYGGTTFYSNGGSSHTYGNTTFFSNGGSCHSYGSTRFCN